MALDETVPIDGDGSTYGVLVSELAAAIRTLRTSLNAGGLAIIADDDGDTKIQVEEGADEDKIRFDTAGSERVVIDENGAITIAGNVTTTKENALGVSALSGASDKYTGLSCGRTGTEGWWGIVATTDQFFTGTVAGDFVCRVDDDTKKLFIGARSSGGAALIVEKNKVTIGSATYPQTLEVTKESSGAILILSSASNYWTALTIGRTGVEVYFGIAGGNNQFFTGTAAGDTMFRLDSTSNKIHFGIGTSGTAELVIANGLVGLAVSTPTAVLDVNSNIIRLRTAKTPASSGAAGNQGDICWDADYIYVCTATNTWERAAIAVW